MGVIGAMAFESAAGQMIAELKAENKRLRAALEPLVAACEADCCNDATEKDDMRCDDDEAVAATQEKHGPIKESALTFGMIRRGRAALATNPSGSER